MEGLEALHGRQIYLDANVFVYATELLPEQAKTDKMRHAIEVARELISLINAEKIIPVTSYLTRSELLVKPLRDGNEALAEFYRQELSGGRAFEEDFIPSVIRMCEVSPNVLDAAAFLRAETGLKMGDAIHLATAHNADCDVFVCNDRKLAQVAEETGAIDVVLLQEFNRNK